jgi:hypothetical protein
MACCHSVSILEAPIFGGVAALRPEVTPWTKDCPKRLSCAPTRPGTTGQVLTRRKETA